MSVMDDLNAKVAPRITLLEHVMETVTIMMKGFKKSVRNKKDTDICCETDHQPIVTCLLLFVTSTATCRI